MVDVTSLERRVLSCFVAGESAAYQNVPLSDIQQQQLDALLTRRAAHEPLAYIIGEKEFWSLNFKVTADTLIPRPDSETLIEAVLEYISRSENNKRSPQSARHPSGMHALAMADFRVLDLGTGTGCLLLSLLSELPNATGVGVDISERALAVAQENADNLGLSARCSFICSDWLHDVNGEFDIILANPPYIASNEIDGLMPDVAHYEPELALDGGEDGLVCYRHLAAKLPHVMAKKTPLSNMGGIFPTGISPPEKALPGKSLVVFEIGATQLNSVSALLIEAGFTIITTRHDLAGLPRAIVATYS